MKRDATTANLDGVVEYGRYAVKADQAAFMAAGRVHLLRPAHKEWVACSAHYHALHAESDHLGSASYTAHGY